MARSNIVVLSVHMARYFGIGALADVGSLDCDGALAQKGSLYVYGALIQVGSLPLSGALGVDGSHSCPGALALSGSLVDDGALRFAGCVYVGPVPHLVLTGMALSTTFLLSSASGRCEVVL